MIEESKEYIVVEKSQLQTLYDMVIGSLDYGSGFFDESDVATLYAVGRLIGADQDAHAPAYRNTPHLWHQDCALPYVCGRPSGDDIHRPVLPS